MKPLVFIFLLINFSILAQNFDEVDALVTKYPRFSKAEDLAAQINQDFKSDLHKARATFFWLTKNIRYNIKEYNNPVRRRYRIEYASEEEKNYKLQAVKDKLVAAMFLNKTGVCEEYAQSFKKICDLLGIEAEVIKGYTRNSANEIGTTASTTNHAWNAVKINGDWLLLDATWAAGYNNGDKWIREFNDYFFDIPKHKILKTHYADNSLWVLRFGRMSLDEFYQQPIYSPVFLNSKTELISPKTGSIRINSTKDIELKFKNFDTSKLVSYNFEGEKYSYKPIIKTVDGVTTFSIKNPKRNTKMILFINREDALHFKVYVK